MHEQIWFLEQASGVKLQMDYEPKSTLFGRFSQAMDFWAILWDLELQGDQVIHFLLFFFFSKSLAVIIRPLEEFELLGLASVRLKMGNIKQKYSFLIHIPVLSPWNKCKRKRT